MEVLMLGLISVRMQSIRLMTRPVPLLIIAITQVWRNWVGETERFPIREMAGVLVKDRPGLKEQQSRMDLSKKVAVEATVPRVNILQEVLVKPMDPLPSLICMVVPVVVPDNIWVLVQEEVRSPLKHMVMAT